MENNDKKIKAIVDELLAPINQRDYQDVLNKRITEDDSHLIDSWIKFLEYERKEKEVEESLEEFINETPSNEDVKPNGIHFETPDLSKYERKPNEPKMTEDQLEIDLLINNIDVSEELNVANAIIDRDLLTNNILEHLENEKDILVSEKIQEELLERFHYHPVNIGDTEIFYKENGISLEIPCNNTFYTTYVLKVKGETIKVFDVILTTNKIDNGIVLSYQIIEY